MDDLSSHHALEIGVETAESLDSVIVMGHVDLALLMSEWVTDSDGKDVVRCPSCGPRINWTHQPKCVHDLALIELGYPSQTSRNRARAKLARSKLRSVR